MKLAIVGSVKLEGNEEAISRINEVLNRLKPDVVISGGAKGIDQMAVKMAKIRGIPTIEHLPKEPHWYYYKKRNIKIANDCDHLVRIVSTKTRTYGSGWTRDYAKSKKRSCEEYIIHE